MFIRTVTHESLAEKGLREKDCNEIIDALQAAYLDGFTEGLAEAKRIWINTFQDMKDDR